MRVLLVVFSDAGHLNAMLAVAQHLEAQGHELTLVSVQADIAARSARAGLKARCVTAGPAAGAAPSESQRSVKLAQRIGNPRWLKRWLATSLIDAVPGALETIETELRDTTPDVVVTDAMAYAGAVAATRAGVPWAALSTTALSLVPPNDPTAVVLRELGPARQALAASLGTPLSFRASDVVSPHLNVAFVVPELFPEGAGDLQLLGAALPRAPLGPERAFPWDRLPDDGRPIVLVCFGSHLSPRSEIYGAICGALNADEAFFVVVLKDLLDEPFVADLPSHALVVEYTPQLQLLERCAAMVHHGGANSVMECITRGVPMMIVPLGYDQRALGAASERAGIGVMLDQADANGDRLRSSLLALLAADGPRQRAQQLAHANREGAARAAALVEELGRRSH